MLDAAIGLYAEAGWAGFSYEALARRSGVGKAGLYARWKSREALLRRTLEARWLAPARIDTGSLRGDLLALAGQIFGVLTSDHAGVARWMPADAVRHPEVEAALTPYREATVSQGRAIVRRAIARGEIAPSVNPGLLMDLVVGGVTNHVSTTPRRLRAAMIAKSERFSADLVDAVLRGVGAGEPISPASS
ncbi:TetR/AcrR family transcriptional regulator [Phenylobacterium montanum]|uniref:TetR/AcrR family transcriptional regulator n=1 Tax=Phenylobacterium montanum TaxID=2823693 RepID=A0A975FVM2_9CAUL|nr:TetR/AcrR family transcriptional regulator [Caulobacter sp. S6]QUD85971.1 TetR/AcrR family transcriptional regulator [Caulobacter sp. S6]